jgi:hypothetical protein
MNIQKIQREQIQRQLEIAGVIVDSLGAGCLRLRGHHSSLVLTADLLNLRVGEIRKLTGGL